MTRRITLVASMLLLIMTFAAAQAAVSHHQDEETDPLAGVTIEPLSSRPLADDPDQVLLLIRITMEPGVVIPAHSHPGPVALSVESGRFGTELVEGTGNIQRAVEGGTPVPEDASAGEQYVLEPGDAFSYEGAVHTMTNEGDEPVVLLISAVFAADQPGFMFMDMSTPAP